MSHILSPVIGISSEKDETGEDDTDVDNEVEECVWVP